MFKERLERKVDEIVLRSTKFGIGRGLKREGKPCFDQFIQDYKNGEQILFSRYIHMLDGFDYESNISGLDNLGGIKDYPILIVANHPYEDPLRGGHGQRIVINYYVDKITQQEVRWLHGLDKTSPEQFTRKRFAKQSNTILVRDNDPETSLKLIRQAFRNKDTMGINPEGDGNKTLLRGKPKAGQMILLAILHNYNIVCVATEFKNDAFFITIDQPLDNEMIKDAARTPTDSKDFLQQTISDYAMAGIAQHLPEDKQGYYRSYHR